MRAGLEGFKVVTFESRKAKEMAKLIVSHGGTAINAPSMQEIPLEKNAEAFQFAEKLFAGKIHVMIFLTGVGARALVQTLVTRYKFELIIEALSKTYVVVRGPKPVRVLREWGVPIQIQAPEPNTWREIIEALDSEKKLGSLKGRNIAVQEYGIPNDPLAEALKRRGAQLIRVPVYRWALPDDTRPLKRAIGQISRLEAKISLFTSATQIHHVMRIAAEEGQEAALKESFKRIVVASIGPVCSEALLSYGIGVDIEPQTSKMGAFVIEVAKSASQILQKKGDQVQVGEASPPRTSSGTKSLDESIFMKALRTEKTPRTPIWLMRQAGRYMKEYRKVRKKTGFLELCKNDDLVCEVTVTAQEALGADAAIIFSDLLIVIEALGLGIEYGSGDGPRIKSTIEDAKDIEGLNASVKDEAFSFLAGGIRKTREKLQHNVPLLGFAGAPFTIASYMIEGKTSKTFSKTKEFMYKDPRRWALLMDRICSALHVLTRIQAKAGVQAIQIFDSWVGCLSPNDYEKYVLLHSSRVIHEASRLVPVIHFGTGTQSLLELMSQAGGDVIGVDSRMRLGDAWARIGFKKAIMGNLDPSILLAQKPMIKKHVQEILAEAQGRPGHIFNLGHGILPNTPFENAKYLVDTVHELSTR